MKWHFILLIAIAIGSKCIAQVECAQHILERQMRNQNIELEERFQIWESEVFSNQLNTAIRAEKIIIPVVFHVIHANGTENISEAQILDAVRILNEDYSATNATLSEVVSSFESLIGTGDIEFRLAKIDPDGDPTTGIDRIASNETFIGDESSKLNNWPRDQYLNFWITDVISISGAAAYAYRPPAAHNIPSRDGIIANHRFVGTIGTAEGGGGTTLTHEVGHYLGLQHTWGGTNSPGCDGTNPDPPCNGDDNCNEDDGINDTPNCLGVTFSTCNLSQQSCGSLDNIQNFMDYSSCDVMFTDGQINVMRNVLNSSQAEREDLWTQSNLEATGVITLTEAAYSVASKTVCTGESVQFFDQSTYDADSWSWVVRGTTEYTSTDQNPIFQLHYPGNYTVELTVTQGGVSKTIVDNNAIIATGSFGTGAPYFETFLDDKGWSIDNHYLSNKETTWILDSTIGFDDTHCFKMANSGSEPSNFDDLTFNSVDFRGVTKAEMTFRVAYAQKAITNTDKLELLVSDNCGVDWRLAWSASGSTLAGSTGTKSGVFTPTSSDWESFGQNNVPISWLSENTLVRFRFTSGYGNDLFLDNINITGKFGDVPRLAYPVNNASRMNSDVVLDWHAVPEAISYEYQLDVAPELNSASLQTGTITATTDQSDGNDTRLETADLEFGQTYFWRVRSAVNSGNSEWSETWSFTVAADGVGFQENLGAENRLKCYPNPAWDRLRIDMQALNEVSEVAIWNLEGQKLLSKAVLGNSTLMEIEVGNLPQGTYFISASHGAGVSMETLIISK